MWPRIVAGIFIPVGNHYFQALASTLQFVAQVCDRQWLVPATDRAFAYITYVHVALVCSGPPQCAATCGWTKWPVCSALSYGRIFCLESQKIDGTYLRYNHYFKFFLLKFYFFKLKFWLQLTQNLNRNLKKEQRYGVNQLFLFEMSRHTTM